MEGSKKNLKFTKRWATFLLLTLFCNMFVIATPVTQAAGNWWEEQASFSDANTINIGDFTFSRDACSVENGNCDRIKKTLVKKDGAIADLDHLMIYTTGINMSLPPDKNLDPATNKQIISDPAPSAIVYNAATKLAKIVWIGDGNAFNANINVSLGIRIETANAPGLPQPYWPSSIYGNIELKARDGSEKPVDSSSFLDSRVIVIDTSTVNDAQMNQRGWEAGTRPIKANGSGNGYYYQIDFPLGRTGQGKNKFLSNTNYIVAILNSTKDGKSCIDGSEQIQTLKSTLGDGAWGGFVSNFFLKMNPLTSGPSVIYDMVQGFKKTTTGEVCDLQYTGAVSFSFDDAGIVTVNDDSTTFEKLTNDYRVGIEQTTANKGINITITEELDSPMDKFITAAIQMMLGGVTTGLKWTVGNINGLLTQTEDVILGEVGETSSLNNAWISIRNIALSLLVMALVIIAFANVMQVDLEQYGLARMIPRIIISIIMAFASWAIVMFFFDLCAAIQAQAKHLASGIDILESIANVNVTVPNASQVVANVGMLILVMVVLVGVWLCGIVLLFTLLLRIIMLAFLLVVAPLAFILNIMPFTASMYKQWWDEFFKWMFMGPIAFAIIALGGVIASSIGTGTGTGTQSLTDGTALNLVNMGERGGMLIGLLIFAASLYMAATLPLQWGGKLMSGWAGMGKKAFKGATGYAYEASSLKGFMSDRKKNIENRRRSRALGLRELVAGSGKNPLRNALVGNALFNRSLSTAEAARIHHEKVDDIIKSQALDKASEGELNHLQKQAREGSALHEAVFMTRAMKGVTNNGFEGGDDRRFYEMYSKRNSSIPGTLRKSGYGLDFLMSSQDADEVRVSYNDSSKMEGKQLGADATDQITRFAAEAFDPRYSQNLGNKLTEVMAENPEIDQYAALQKALDMQIEHYDKQIAAGGGAFDHNNLEEYRRLRALKHTSSMSGGDLQRTDNQGGPLKYSKHVEASKIPHTLNGIDFNVYNPEGLNYLQTKTLKRSGDGNSGSGSSGPTEQPPVEGPRPTEGGFNPGGYHGEGEDD